MEKGNDMHPSLTHPSDPTLHQPEMRDITSNGLARQLSIQLSPEQFERLYLQPGGYGAPRQEDFTKRFGNPTVLGLASFLVCLSPLSCYLMGFMGTDAGAASSICGVFMLSGGLGLYLAAIMEWIIGNTFPFVVFGAFGGFWLSFGFLQSPLQGIAAAYTVDGVAGASPNFANGLSLWLIFWGLLTFVFLITALRTNVMFVILFLSLDVTFFTLAAGYNLLTKGNTAVAGNLFKVGGAFAFICSMSGWYILMALMLASNNFPFSLPVGDLSSFMSPKRTA